jgi:hypothetical protein
MFATSARRPPRGKPITHGPLSGLRPGEPVAIRDASGEEHRWVAVTGPQWGRDFPVVWVKRPGAPDSEKMPWPLGDVRRLRDGREAHDA